MTPGSGGSPRINRLGILLSGRGSNFLAIAQGIAQGRLDAEIGVVISNRSNAPGIAAARSAGFATQVIEARGRQRAEHDAEIGRRMATAEAELREAAKFDFRIESLTRDDDFAALLAIVEKARAHAIAARV